MILLFSLLTLSAHDLFLVIDIFLLQSSYHLIFYEEIFSQKKIETIFLDSSKKKHQMLLFA
jgi:uncharacterized membrane protein